MCLQERVTCISRTCLRGGAGGLASPSGRGISALVISCTRYTVKIRRRVRLAHCDPLQSDPWQPQPAVCRFCLSLSPPAYTGYTAQLLSLLKRVWVPPLVEGSEGVGLSPTRGSELVFPRGPQREPRSPGVRVTAEPGSRQGTRQHSALLLGASVYTSTWSTSDGVTQAHDLVICK